MLKMQKLYCLSFKIRTSEYRIVFSIQYVTVTYCRPIDWNFGTNEKVAIPIPIVTCTLPSPIPIPILVYMYVFPFPWDSHWNGNPIPMHISITDRI